MKHAGEQILSILDSCCEAFTFPMLDNGYVYLAATRLSLFRSDEDWAMVIEVFGYSPRAGLPDTGIHTFSSNLVNRDTEDQYVNKQAHQNYLTNNPFNELRAVYPIDGATWRDVEDEELVAATAEDIVVRGNAISVPRPQAYHSAGIKLECADRVQVFELCRYLAHLHRDEVLATPQERRVSVAPELALILTLDEWSHPDLANDEKTSDSITFQQLACVLATGDLGAYRACQPSNTHWQHWPEAGTL